jgi:hypothetical protein
MAASAPRRVRLHVLGTSGDRWAGTVTGYGLDGCEFGSLNGNDPCFFHSIQNGPGDHRTSDEYGEGHSLGVKGPGRDARAPHKSLWCVCLVN